MKNLILKLLKSKYYSLSRELYNNHHHLNYLKQIQKQFPFSFNRYRALYNVIYKTEDRIINLEARIKKYERRIERLERWF